MTTPHRIVFTHLGMAVVGSLASGALAVGVLHALAIPVPRTVSGLGLVGAWFGMALHRGVQQAYAAGQAEGADPRPR